jgi:hypothetical protein
LNNRRLAKASAALAVAQIAQDPDAEEVERAEIKVQAAKAKVEKTRAEGSAERVGTRMGWA